jgi:hypothetical protein
MMKEPCETKKHIATNLEETLKRLRDSKSEQRDAARQWSLLVWSLANDARPISEDASLLGKELVQLIRCGDYKEKAKLLEFVKDSARQEEDNSSR